VTDAVAGSPAGNEAPDVDGAPPPQVAVAPGRYTLGPTIARFDRWADISLERLRGNPVADAVFTTATHLGDWSLIWHLVNVTRGLTSERRAAQVPTFALALGAESLLVNQGLKRLFKRPRPTLEGDPRFRVRRPLTSAFPSGHASAAAFAAVLLTSWDGRRAAPVWWTLAAAVGASRAYVRIHHASDVVAGMATGAVLGLAARQVLRRTGMHAGRRRLAL
jgi:undecaprenyl-diphosphatase